MIFTSCFLVFILGIRHGKIQGCVQTANFFWISKGFLALGIKQMQFAEINIHENVFAWARDRVIADGNQLTLFTLAIMYRGNMEMLDTPSHVYNMPASIFCARFIGSPSMNIISCQYENGNLSIGDQMIRLAPMWRPIADACPSGKYCVGNTLSHGHGLNLVMSDKNHGRTVHLVDLIGSAQRVPTPTGSTTILVAVVKGKVTVDEINAAMKAAANESFGYNTSWFVL